MDTTAGCKTKYVELLHAFISTILQKPKSTGTAVHQQKNSGFVKFFFNIHFVKCI